MTKKQRLSVYAGHVIDNFDNMLFGFFAVALAPLFFPSDNAVVSYISSFGAFGAGFLARPFGAMFWGRLGDRYGRKLSMTYSLSLMGVPTFIIGILPTYDDIGMAAPVILVICRLLQGFFIGGEYAGACLYMSEVQNKQNVGKNNSILVSSGFVGAILGTLLGALALAEFTPDWSWRFLFILGGIFAMSIYFLRRNLPETDEFCQEKNSRFIGFSEAVQNNLVKIIPSVFLFGYPLVSFYIAIIYGNSIFQKINFSSSQSMLIGTFTILVVIFSSLIVGRIADRVGFYKILVYSISLGILSGGISFWFITRDNPNLFNVLSFVFFLTIVTSGSGVCMVPFISRLFNTRERFTLVAIAVTVGETFWGGLTPLVSTAIEGYMGSVTWVYAWFLLSSVLALLSVIFLGRFKISQSNSDSSSQNKSFMDNGEGAKLVIDTS